MSQLKYILSLSACLMAFATYPLLAQDNPLSGKDSIVLENERIQDVMDSKKPFVKPPYQEIQEATKEDFQFNSRDFYVETDFDPAPPVIKPWPKEKKDPLKNNALSLGIGRFITPYAKLNLHSGPGNNLNVGLDFTHLSAHQDKIPLRKFRQDYGTVTVASIQRQFKVQALAYVYNTSYFPYADTVLANDEEAREDSLRIGFTRARLGANLSTNYDPNAQYEADAGVYLRYFAGNRGNAETNFDLLPKAAYFVTKEFKAGFEGELTLSGGRLGESEQTRFYLDATPYVAFDNGTVRLKAGFKYNAFRNSLDTSAFTNFGGLVELAAGINPDQFSFLVGYQTGMTNNSYYDLLFENPYLLQDVRIQPTIEKLNLYLGGKGNIGGTIDYSARIYYKRLANQLMFFTEPDGFYFDLVYDSLMTVAGTQLEVKFRPEDFLDLGATFNLNIYNTSTQVRYFHATPLRLDLYGVYRWEEKLTARGELIIFGPRTMSVDENEELVRQGIFPSINLAADYRITEGFSVFLKLNNLLGSNYQRWHNYPERRIDFLGGLTIAF